MHNFVKDLLIIEASDTYWTPWKCFLYLLFLLKTQLGIYSTSVNSDTYKHGCMIMSVDKITIL